jgi:hypothetical protein
MAPALTDALPTAPHNLASTAPRDIFPDGLKTTGQHPPLYDHIVPFDGFPREITGPTVWKAADYRENPEKWTHKFTEEQVEELSIAADAFLASKTPLTGISKVCFTAIPGYIFLLANSRYSPTSPCPGLQSTWKLSVRISSMGRDSFCSRVSLLRNGAITSLPLHTWAWVPT